MTRLRRAARHPPRRATRFFKPHERIYTMGLRAAEVRAVARDLGAAVKRIWRWSDAVAFTDRMLRERTIEARSVGLLVLARFRRQLDARILAPARRWLAAGRCDNWALTDLLCMEVLGPLLDARPELAGRLAPWAGARSLWVRRAAAAALTGPARHGVALDLAYRTAYALRGDAEDLIHKATGWLLREAGKTDAARLERWLRRHGHTLPRTALRYAIERFPAVKRARILRLTAR
jgi:3-methyladenine DNA glycosylase AlkD